MTRNGTILLIVVVVVVGSAAVFLATRPTPILEPAEAMPAPQETAPAGTR